ncbi:unnamed protein product [Sphagnum tenellum]
MFLAPKASGVSGVSSLGTMCPALLLAASEKLIPSPRLELLTKVAVESQDCSFCHRYAVDISELLPFFSAWPGAIRAASASPSELPTRVVVENWARPFVHRYANGFSELLLFLSNYSSAPLE